MDSIAVADTEALVSDLRIATRYAARLGLLRDEAVFGKLQCVEQSLKCESGVNAHALTVALNDVAQLIAPMTVADLRFGRDPFLPSNQQKSWWLQLGLAVVALCVLLITGYFMHSLRTEQAGLKALKQLESMHPQSAMTALRKMAQEDLPRENSGLTLTLYRQKGSKFVELSRSLYMAINKGLHANSTTLFPSLQILTSLYEEPPLPPTYPPSTDGELCPSDSDGKLVVPSTIAASPGWMQRLQIEAMDDYCYMLNVLPTIDGQAALPPDPLKPLKFIPEIESKVSLRSNWFLPFFFGTLGSILFVMRNVANVRTPAMLMFSAAMRIALGGVAGIVVGWFAAAALPGAESTNALSVPFALAFLTGYSIDSLFGLLDRLSHGVGAGAQPQKP